MSESWTVSYKESQNIVAGGEEMNDFTRFPDTISSVTNDSKLY